MCHLYKSGQVFHTFIAITASQGQNWYIQEPQALYGNMKIPGLGYRNNKEEAIELVSWGDDNFSQAGEMSLPSGNV